MKNWVTIAIFFGLILLLGIFIGKSCNGDKIITHTDAELAEQIKGINETLSAIQDSMQLLAKQRNETINYYNYEIIKMDSSFPNSTIAHWDSVILAWTDIIYGLPGFFDIRTYEDSTLQGGKDSSASSKPLQTEYLFEGRIRPGENSSW